MSLRRITSCLTAALAAASALSGCTNPPPPPPPPPPPTSQVGAVKWELCRYDHTKPQPSAQPGDAECGAVKVPIDRSQKDGGVVDMVVVRRTATDPEHKIGTLVVFPTEQGASGVDELLGTAGTAPSFGGLEKNFDLVSFTPRGVSAKYQLHGGESNESRVLCETFVLADSAAARRTGISGVDQLAKARAAGESIYNSCRQHSGLLLEHLDAAAVAQDVEVLRQSLGVDKISIYAHEYSTLEAQAYLRAFGGHVRAAVLDAPVNPALSVSDFASQLAGALEAGYQRFADWCAGEPTCALGKQDAWDAYTGLQDQAGKDGGLVNKAFPDTPLDPAYLNWQIDHILYQSDYPTLASYLKALESKQPFPGAPEDELSPGAPALIPTTEFRLCQDIDLRLASDSVDKVVAAEREAAPHFGYSPYANRVLVLCLASSPAFEAQHSPSPSGTAGTAPTPAGGGAASTLVIGSTGNIGAPYAWSQAVAQKLGPTAALVGVDDASDKPKIAEPGPPQHALVTYLTTLMAPPVGTILAPN